MRGADKDSAILAPRQPNQHRRDRVVGVAAGVGVLYLIGYAMPNMGGAQLSGSMRAAVDVVSVAALAAPIVALSAAAVRRRRRGAQGRQHRPWAYFAGSTSLTAAGTVLAANHDQAATALGPLDAVGNGLLIAAFVAAAAGFFAALQPGNRSTRLWMGADLVLAVAGVTALVGRLAATAETPAMAVSTRTTMLVYAISGIATVVLLVPLIARIGRHASPALRLVCAAYLVNAVVNVALLRAVLTGRAYHEGSWLSVGYQLGMVLLTLAGLMAARRIEDTLIPLPARDDRTMPLSIAAAAAAVAGLTMTGLKFDKNHFPQLIAALVLVGLLLRLWLVMRERTLLAEQLAEALADQQHLAVTDPLTGLANRRYFENALTVELARARRHDRSVSLVILDLDHFKTINDVHGHPAGDAVLTQVASLLQECTRGSDVVARFGGEEFVWLLPDTTEDGAAIMAERLNTTLAAHPLALPGGALLRVTASIGIAAGLLDGPALLSAADQALYRAKATGRNRVVRASTATHSIAAHSTGPGNPAAARYTEALPTDVLLSTARG
ncbi:diguanylate cyclase [Cryptosporangium sp. NPDC048952]|uniref:GGDEF domain-containing protein n=1 Tax=Cryptosporangium sp. NPDC048952 TaxID=3363961 RepID=UPI003723AB0D